MDIGTAIVIAVTFIIMTLAVAPSVVPAPAANQPIIVVRESEPVDPWSRFGYVDYPPPGNYYYPGSGNGGRARHGTQLPHVSNPSVYIPPVSNPSVYVPPPVFGGRGGMGRGRGGMGRGGGGRGGRGRGA